MLQTGYGWQSTSTCSVATPTCIQAQHRQLPTVDHFVLTGSPRPVTGSIWHWSSPQSLSEGPRENEPSSWLQITREHHPVGPTKWHTQREVLADTRLLWAHPAQWGQFPKSSLYAVVVAIPHSQPALRVNPTHWCVNSEKAQQQQEGRHKPHKGHSWNNWLKWSGRLCHWDLKDTYYISPPCQDRCSRSTEYIETNTELQAK